MLLKIKDINNMLYPFSKTLKHSLGNVLHSKLSLQIPGIILFCVCLWGHVQFCCELFSFRTYKAEAPQTFWPWNTNICNQIQEILFKLAAEVMELNSGSLSQLQKCHKIEIPIFFPFVLYLYTGIIMSLCQQTGLFILPWFIPTDYSQVCSFLFLFLQPLLPLIRRVSSCIIVLGLPVSGALPATPTEPALLSRTSSNLRQRCKVGFYICTPPGPENHLL